jgi:hypothetical protein
MHPRDACENVPRHGSISVATPDECSHWAKAFSVTEAVLMKAVEIVGTSVAELRKLFCRDNQDRR